MVEWISKLEKWLQPWLEKTQMQWIQWIYALWQLIRCNPLTLIVLSFLPFYIAQRLRKKTVVVLGDSKDYDVSVAEMKVYLRSRSVNNLEILTRLPIYDGWYSVKHRGHVYVTHQNAICELVKCSQLFGENLIFVERLLILTGFLAVGRKLSQTEAYEKLFSKRYHCGKGAAYVVPTFLDYVDLSSKIWGVLSTLPILLQARRYNRLSTLLSLVIIILDFNRGWLYRVYDYIFDCFVKLVKLHVFKERTDLYNFCSLFSSRWRYSDTTKKFAYVAQAGQSLRLRCYSKVESLQDIDIVGWEQYKEDPNDRHICMEIVKDRAYCSLMEEGSYNATVILHRPVYVS